jgi:outer membrane receptor protein involved in Fe transport
LTITGAEKEIDDMKKLYLFCLVMCFAAAPLLAQSTGTIFGTVTDPSGAAVPGAKVDAVLIERGTLRSTTTDAVGEYTFALMPIGAYEIRVENAGFAEFKRSPITLDANQSVKVDAQLAMRGTAQSVTVNANVAQVDTRTATLGTLVDGNRIVDLPLNGRTVFGFMQLLPGATGLSAPQIYTGDRTGPTVSLDGVRPGGTLNLFDGQDFAAFFRNTGENYPPPDAVDEVKVLTSNYSAEYGRFGAVINVVTKSGSNNYHGDVWEFLRNNDLNARNFFIPTRPQLIQNQFGGTVGGPIKKDKVFFFASYEALRIRQGSNQGLQGSAGVASNSFPLTANQRAGLFASSTPVIDPQSCAPPAPQPCTLTPFPLSSPGVYQIPMSRIDPTAAKFLLGSNPLLPLPNTPSGTLLQLFPEPNTTDQGLGRIDYNYHTNHLFTLRFNDNHMYQVNFGGNVPSYQPQDVSLVQTSVLGADTWTINPHLVNQLRLAYNRDEPITNIESHVTLASLGATFPVIGAVGYPSSVNISGYASLGSNGGGWNLYVNEERQIKDNVSWTIGKHTFNFGGEYANERYPVSSYYNTSGTFGFTGSFTGNAAADFFLGLPASLSLSSPQEYYNYVTSKMALYGQDDWRVSRRLTFNIGVRWDILPMWHDPFGNIGAFHPGQQSKRFPNAPTGLVYYGDPGVARDTAPVRYDNFGPRLGFAYDVFGDGRTSIRGGFGIFYEPSNPGGGVENFQPFVYSYSFTAPYSFTNPLFGQAAVPTAVNLTNPIFSGIQTGGTTEVPFRLPYDESFDLAVQREVARNTVITISYVGHFSHREQISLDDLNNPVGATSVGTEQAHRPYQGFGDMSLGADEARANYNALYVEGTKRMSDHFSLQFAYAYSKAQDENTALSPLLTGVSQPWNPRIDWGLAATNATNNFSMSWIVDLPKLSQQSKALRAIAGGWQWNGLLVAMSGNPQNPVSGQDRAFSGTSNQRPNLVGQWRLPGQTHGQEVAEFFNPAAFALPAAGTFGNSGRDVVIGPDYKTLNLALFKNIPLGWEKTTLQFRWEVFNSLNNVNFSPPGMSLGSSMGKITSANDPRIMQFALKVLF